MIQLHNPDFFERLIAYYNKLPFLSPFRDQDEILAEGPLGTRTHNSPSESYPLKRNGC
jgi:hypothetical protein